MTSSSTTNGRTIVIPNGPNSTPRHSMRSSPTSSGRARPSDELARGHELEEFVKKPGKDREPVDLRWIYLHMIEEYARHCGHADILRVGRRNDGYCREPRSLLHLYGHGTRLVPTPLRLRTRHRLAGRHRCRDPLARRPSPSRSSAQYPNAPLRHARRSPSTYVQSIDPAENSTSDRSAMPSQRHGEPHCDGPRYSSAPYRALTARATSDFRVSRFRD